MTKKDKVIKEVMDSLRTMAEEQIRLLNGAAEKAGPEAGRALALMFMQHYVETLLTNVLVEYANSSTMPNELKYEKTERNYRHMKAAIQNTIGDAFSAALSRFSSQPLDYFCDISLSPEPINKHAC